MAKINRKEYEILKGLDDEWKWVARDKNGSLFAYLEKPLKDPYSGDWGLTGDEWFLIKEILFHFIQWEDEEPHNIQELIEEYEKYKKASDYFKVNIKNVNQSMLDVLPTEIEETEVKNIEWLKEEITDILLTSKKDGTNYFYYRDLKEKIYNAIDQLDERETLSQEWIDEHITDGHNVNLGDKVVYADELDGVLVPEQEITEKQRQLKKS